MLNVHPHTKRRHSGSSLITVTNPDGSEIRPLEDDDSSGPHAPRVNAGQSKTTVPHEKGGNNNPDINLVVEGESEPVSEGNSKSVSASQSLPAQPRRNSFIASLFSGVGAALGYDNGPVSSYSESWKPSPSLKSEDGEERMRKDEDATVNTSSSPSLIAPTDRVRRNSLSAVSARLGCTAAGSIFDGGGSQADNLKEQEVEHEEEAAESDDAESKAVSLASGEADADQLEEHLEVLKTLPRRRSSVNGLAAYFKATGRVLTARGSVLHRASIVDMPTAPPPEGRKTRFRSSILEVVIPDETAEQKRDAFWERVEDAMETDWETKHLIEVHVDWLLSKGIDPSEALNLDTGEVDAKYIEDAYNVAPRDVDAKLKNVHWIREMPRAPREG